VQLAQKSANIVKYQDHLESHGKQGQALSGKAGSRNIEEDQSFVADVPELPGCMAHGASPDEALANAQ